MLVSHRCWRNQEVFRCTVRALSLRPLKLIEAFSGDEMITIALLSGTVRGFAIAFVGRVFLRESLRRKSRVSARFVLSPLLGAIHATHIAQSPPP